MYMHPIPFSFQLPLLSLYVELGLHTNAHAVADKNGDRYRIMGVLRVMWREPHAWQEVKRAAVASVGAGGSAGSRENIYYRRLPPRVDLAV